MLLNSGHLAETTENLRTDELLLNMGPQHPSTHGVLRVVVTTDGEIVKAAHPEIGYLHRCFEKHAEAVDYVGVCPYVDRHRAEEPATSIDEDYRKAPSCQPEILRVKLLSEPSKSGSLPNSESPGIGG